MDMGGGSMSGPACKISMLFNTFTIDSCFLSSSWHVNTQAQFAGSCIGIFLLVVAIEAVRRLGRDYDRRLVARHNAAKASLDCGLGSPVVKRSNSLLAEPVSSAAVAPSPSVSSGDSTVAAVPAKKSCCASETSAPVENDDHKIDIERQQEKLRHVRNIDAAAHSGGFIRMQCRPKVPALPSWPQQVIRGTIYGTQFTAAFLVMLIGMYFNIYTLICIFLGGWVGNILFASDTIGSAGELSKSESPCCC